uniref:Uncharacterized protein n=1 Tax=Tanacetum cinerariifolium TaxID=118510 RepID=A0A6L2KWD5_TANCI|nr:hypothetical protein [Tanacetum cinerariifolium]
MENEENCIKKRHIINAPSRNIKKCGVVERVNAEARESAAAEALDGAVAAVAAKKVVEENRKALAPLKSEERKVATDKDLA